MLLRCAHQQCSSSKVGSIEPSNDTDPVRYDRHERQPIDRAKEDQLPRIEVKKVGAGLWPIDGKRVMTQSDMTERSLMQSSGVEVE